MYVAPVLIIGHTLESLSYSGLMPQHEKSFTTLHG